MRVTTRDIATIIKNSKDNDQLRILLRRIFSFPENIDTFSKYFFPHAIKGKVPKFHKRIYRELFKDQNIALAAPRGHSKSTCTGVVYLIFNIVNNLQEYIVYISQNHAKTIQFLTPIRHEFKNNERLQWVYGDLTPKNTKDDTGKDREDCFDVNGIRVEAVSFEKNLRGFKYGHMRPTLICLDDIESDDRVRNPELRLKDSEKLNKVIIPALDINGKIKFIGTILHHDSLLNKKIKQYGGFILSAEDGEDGDTLWPERFPHEKLQAIKKDIGPLAYKQEFLNDPTDTASSIIRREWITNCYREDLSYVDLQSDYWQERYNTKVLGVDFAFSDAVTADESAFVGVGEYDGFKYLFYCKKEKGMSGTDQMIQIKNILHARYRFLHIGVEENSIKAISKDLSQYHLPIKLYWTAATDPAKKKREDNYHEKRQTVGKFNLIQRLATAFENREFVLPYKTEEDKILTERICSELTTFALADGKLIESGIHSDIGMALGFACECLSIQPTSFFFA